MCVARALRACVRALRARITRARYACAYALHVRNVYSSFSIGIYYNV